VLVGFVPGELGASTVVKYELPKARSLLLRLGLDVRIRLLAFGLWVMA
jgi:hypothetical protein